MFVKIFAIIFCSCILILYVSQICYLCVEHIIGFWLYFMFLFSFCVIIINQVISKYKNRKHLPLQNDSDMVYNDSVMSTHI